MAERSLERGEGLLEAGTLQRHVKAGLDRVWENVRDWEHLPWVHAQSFTSIRLCEAGAWGWHAEVGLPGGGCAEIELCIDMDRRRYVARTLAGAGAGGEIWTTLTPEPGGETRVDVAFWLPAPEGGGALPAGVGEGYRGLYERLWDEDERMMRERSHALAQRARRKPGAAGEVTILGPVEDLRGRLPMVAARAGGCFRVLEIAGDLVAHTVECPHRLGPLGEARLEQGELVCPWHGYRFDPRTGRSSDGRGLALAPAPRVEIDVVTGQVVLVSDEGPGAPRAAAD